MQVADGGYRPADNVQFSTTTDSQVIVGVDVNHIGSDQGQLSPMLDQVEQRYEERPAQCLVDGGYARHDEIEQAQARGTTVYAAVPKPKELTRDPYVALPGYSQAIAQWRARMGTAAAKDIYKQSTATAECVGRGLTQFLVRGLGKVKAVALWFAIAHNLMRAISRAQPG